MDIETAVICIACVVVSALVIYLTSHFAIKERTFDEVMEEQRKRNNIDTVFKSSSQKQKAEKARKEKKDKSKKTVKKVKEKEATADFTSSGDAELSNKEAPEIKVVTEKGEMNVKREHKSKAEHVDFKEPDLIDDRVDEQKESALHHRNISSGSDKMLKPILVVKAEVGTKLEQHDSSKLSMEPKFQKRNSFHLLRPKDELELAKVKKHHQEIEKAPKVTNQNVPEASPVVTIKSEANNSENIKVVAVNGNATEELVQSSEDTKPAKSNGSIQKSKKKSASNANLEQGSKSEVPSKNILQQINSNILTNEEIQLLINALLNKQSSNGSSEWMKKNDPTNALKKQLREKDQLLEAEKHNSQAAMARMKELRHELEQEKAKEKVERERDLQSLHTRYQQQQLIIQEQHRNEIKALQAKLADELSRVQEEKSRLQQHERQRQLAIQQSQAQIQQLDEHLKSLANAKQKDEFSFQQKLNELSSQLQQVEASKASLVDELQQKCKECNSLESENISLKKNVEEALEEKQIELKHLNEKISQLNNERKALEETLIAKDKLLLEHKNCNNLDKEVEMKQLSQDLNKFKEELTNAKNEIETQRKKNDELREKNWEVIEALSNAEKQMNSKIESAVSIAEQNFAESLAKEIKARQKLEETLQSTEEKQQQLINERILLVNSLSKFLPINDDNIHQSLQTLCEELHQHRVIANREKVDSMVSTDEDISMKSEFDKVVKEKNNIIEKLIAEKKSLENKIEQIAGLQETIADMEQKLIELQKKLSGEESDRKNLEKQYDEVSKNNRY
ncbi:ribosome-binding protein 1-like isoform X2 [Dinothrombium tinctorium]|uniref:Ribosome-binding protein 1-like isoform X2 n=1 Tax=Dinothrombium tinctorium TaxID=1965070 RepID=A0A3S3R356_9ACAR|nr:ribosome-binding protein 1-like isoform X2 [Dinothrombium tinctorium]RWS17743.1 ribosome-binding protein 1-like isoform X2 [Dinothrombium tinctorium]